jgi:hypothetical protein
MKPLIPLGFSLFIFSTLASASTTICQVDGKLTDPQVITWDSDSRKAKIKYWTGRTYDGVLTLTRKHNDGQKFNLSFTPLGMSADEYEYIVFSVPSGGYRVLGAGFIYSNGVKRLDYGLGGYDATCSTL